MILIAMVAMLFTAISYGRMARAYPSAGSAFTYAAQEIHPGLPRYRLEYGDGLHAQPADLHDMVRATSAYRVPAWGWKIFFAVVFTLLNIRGVKTSARINTVMAITMGAVVAVDFARRRALHLRPSA